MRGNNFLFKIYAAGVMLLLLYSMHAYFLWWMYNSLTYFVILDFFVAIVGFAYISNKKAIQLDLSVLIPFFGAWFVMALNPPNVLGIISRCPFSLLVILLIDRKSLNHLLKIWTNLFAVILSVSLIVYFLAMLGLLPSFGVVSFGDKDNISYVYQNYILCLVNMNLHNFDTIRFNSIFLEPGHVSMIGAFTLYANRYDLKRWTIWAILIASLLTFSLAGYILVIIGYFIICLQSIGIKKIIISIFISSILLVSVYNIAVSYNGGNNLVNSLIIQRTEFDGDRVIRGNNRVSLNTDILYNKFSQSSEFLTGLDFVTYQKYLKNETISGAGYKMYLMEKGILGTLIILLVYLCLSRRALDKRFIYYFLLLFIISFIQRAWPTSYIWLFLFIFATSEQKPGNNILIKIKKAIDNNESIIYS